MCQLEKGVHQLLGGKLQCLAISTHKWDQGLIDFMTCLPEKEGQDTMLTVINKAAKMVYSPPYP